MPRISKPDPEDVEEDVVVPLSAEQVQALRQRQPLLSVWRVIGVQILAGLLTAGLIGWGFGASAAASALFGALAVVIPAALFARGLTGRLASANAGSAVFGFFLWELVKLGLTVAALVTAPRWIEGLSWPAMLAGLVVTMKVYWVALGMRRVFYPGRET
jgi:ATP synthase protein I